MNNFYHWYLLLTLNLELLYFLKLGPIFTSPTLCQFSKYSNFLEAQSFYWQTETNFVSLSWILHNRYYHTTGHGRFYQNKIRSDQFDLMIDNLPPNILKIDLSYCQNLNDLHIEKLVRRCNKITEISLCFTQGNLLKGICNKII